MADDRAILVVDDDEGIRLMVALALEGGGLRVLTAADGREALELVAREPPTLILLDLKMPGMDGWAFARAYRARSGPHAPIVVMTAAHPAGRVAEVRADAELAKPFDLEQLQRVVERFAPARPGAE